MGRIAVVTGGTRGIGRGISEALKAAGYTVIANYAGNKEAAKAFTEETGIASMRWDVGNFDECKHAVKEIAEKFGAIEVLINNAGITRDTMLHKMGNEQWDEVIRTNLTSCYNMARLCIETMREKGFGRIVNISSINGQAGQMGQVNYSAAKSALHGFTKALAQEGASKGITCNALAPGYIDTEMVRAVPPDVLEKIIAKIPVKRLGTVEDIARGVLFLIGDDAGFITGSTLSINGGQHMY